MTIRNRRCVAGPARRRDHPGPHDVREPDGTRVDHDRGRSSACRHWSTGTGPAGPVILDRTAARSAPAVDHRAADGGPFLAGSRRGRAGPTGQRGTAPLGFAQGYNKTASTAPRGFATDLLFSVFDPSRDHLTLSVSPRAHAARRRSPARCSTAPARSGDPTAGQLVLESLIVDPTRPGDRLSRVPAPVQGHARRWCPDALSSHDGEPGNGRGSTTRLR